MNSHPFESFINQHREFDDYLLFPLRMKYFYLGQGIDTDTDTNTDTVTAKKQL